MKCHYSMLIQWSEEDQVYVVSLPEYGPYCKTHGATYEEAARMGQEVLELLIEKHQDQGRPLPKPNRYSAQAEVAKKRVAKGTRTRPKKTSA